MREAEARGLRICFAILNFQRLAGIEPGSHGGPHTYCAPAENGAETSPASAHDPPPSPGPPLPPPSRALICGAQIINFKRSGNLGWPHTTELGAPAAKGAETSPRRAQDPPPSPDPLPPPSRTLLLVMETKQRSHNLLCKPIRADPPSTTPARGLRIYFAILSVKSLVELEGLIHTTEPGRLYGQAIQASSPFPDPRPLHHSPHLPLPGPGSSSGRQRPQNLFRDSKF